MQILLSLPLLEGVDPGRISAPALRPGLRTLPAGTALFDRGDDTHDVYFLISGQLLCAFWTADGKEILFNRIRNRGYFGELSALDGRRRAFTVYCKVRSEVLVLSQPDFLRLVNTVPEISAKVMQDLADFVRSLMRRCYQMTSLNVEQRVRAYIADLAFGSGDLFSGAMLRDVPSHAEIANSIGANREAVTRAMSELNRSKIIESGRKRLRVLSANDLVDMLVE